MPFIPEETLREIRERTNIVELIGEHVALRKAGQSWKGLCPFHGEKTPSFTVNEARGVFHCFGCGAGGTAFDFLMRREGMTFPEAARALARRVGVPVPADDLSPEARRAEAERQALLAVNAAAAAFFRARLAGPDGRAAREYLVSRGLSAETVEAFGLGYAPAGWENLLRHLAGQGHRPETVARAGLAVARESGSGYYDRFRDRLVIPIADAQGRVVAFGGRAMAKDQEPKYLNSAESAVYHKGDVLYGLPQAREAIRRADQVVVVEGYFDCIALHQAGVKETVATCGTALTARHVETLKRYAREVVTLFDGDPAGLRAAERSLELFDQAQVAARVAELPSGEDPDTFVRKVGESGLRARLARARSLPEAFIDACVRQEKTHTIEGKIRVLRAVRPLIARMRDRYARDSYLRYLTDRLGGPGEAEDLIRQHVLSWRPGESGGRVEPPPAARPARRPAVAGAEADGDCLIRAVLSSPDLAAEILSGTVLEALGDPAVSEIVAVAAGLVRERGAEAVSAAGLVDGVTDQGARERLARVAARSGDLPADAAVARRLVEDASLSIRRRAIARELSQVARALRDAETRGATEDMRLLTARAAELAIAKGQVSKQTS
ncbi:MAG TPA: DNA primase [Thermodesulfobacteriota bacterium]